MFTVKHGLQSPYLWTRPVGTLISFYDFSNERKTIIECTDGHFRYVENNVILTDRIHCPRHGISHLVETDQDGKVTRVIVAEA